MLSQRDHNKALIDKAFQRKLQSETSKTNSAEKRREQDNQWMFDFTFNEKDMMRFSSKKKIREVQLTVDDYSEKILEVARRGDMESAMELFEEMIADGIAPDRKSVV